MNRAAFIKNLALLFGAGHLPADMFIHYQKIYLLHFFVRGFKFYQGPKIIDQINQNGLVHLVREPDNEYDLNAIAVYFENQKIGFVPAESNEVLRRILDAKLLDLQAEITKIEPDAQTWEQISVAIYALKPVDTDTPKHLTQVEALQYYTLKNGTDQYSRIYFEEEMIDGATFYEELVANSSTDGIYDVIHAGFDSSNELEYAVNNSRIVIKKESGINQDLEYPHLFETLNNQILEINNAFDEDGYVVANIEQLSKIPDQIKAFVKKTDHKGQVFFEVILKTINT